MVRPAAMNPPPKPLPSFEHTHPVVLPTFWSSSGSLLHECLLEVWSKPWWKLLLPPPNGKAGFVLCPRAPNPSDWPPSDSRLCPCQWPWEGHWVHLGHPGSLTVQLGTRLQPQPGPQGGLAALCFLAPLPTPVCSLYPAACGAARLLPGSVMLTYVH